MEVKDFDCTFGKRKKAFFPKANQQCTKGDIKTGSGEVSGDLEIFDASGIEQDSGATFRGVFRLPKGRGVGKKPLDSVYSGCHKRTKSGDPLCCV